MTKHDTNHDTNHDTKHDTKDPGRSDDYEGQVRRKAERMAASRRRRHLAWRNLAHVGVLGWVLVLPIVAGALLGGLLVRWTGIRPLGLLGLLLGVLAAAYAAWREIRGSLGEEDDT